MKFIAAFAVACSLAVAPAAASPLKSVKGEGFTVMMPGEVKAETKNIGDDRMPMEQKSWASKDDGVVYVVTRVPVPPEAADPSTVPILLEGVRKGVVSHSGGTLVSETKMTIQGHPGIAFHVDTQDNDIKARSVFDGKTSYQLLVIRPKEVPGPHTDAFLTSLKLTK